jgi:hypothetical protein
MNCEQLRERLSELLYGGLGKAERAEAERHLERCSECRRERAALESLAHCLNAVPPIEAQVDLPRLYREAAQRQARQTRHWRRAAVGLAAAAVVLLALVGLRLEVRFEAHQVVVRWGTPPEVVAPPPAPVLPREDAPRYASADEVQLLKELVHALAADVDASQQRQETAVVRLRQRVEESHRQTQRRWIDTERNLAALYTAQFGPRPKGEEP